MNNMEKEINFQDGIYIPLQNKGKFIYQKATLGVKFSNDIFLLRSFLDLKGISYK